MRGSVVILVVVLGAAGCRDGKRTEPAAGSSAGSNAAPAAGSTTASAAVPADAGDAVIAFWQWFSKNAAALRAETDLQLTMERIGGQLSAINEGVFAEI